MASLYRSNIGGFCSAIDLAAERPTLNLSEIDWIDPFALIYLGMFLRYHNAKGRFFRFVQPEARAVRSYLARMRFYERFNFTDTVIDTEKLFRFEASTSLNDIVDIKKEPDVDERVAERVIDMVRGGGCSLHGDPGTLHVIVTELVNNFSRHSGQTLAAFMPQWFPQKGYLCLALGDCGLGIRRTLQRNPEYAYLAQKSDAAAIVLAFRPLVSCQGPALGGTGLADVRETVADADGLLFIASGRDYAMMDEAGHTRTGPVEHDLPGVQAEVRLPTDRG
ncbi:MAG: hypothetical protein ACOC8E_04215 [Planctomycetota bacterium]